MLNKGWGQIATPLLVERQGEKKLIVPINLTCFLNLLKIANANKLHDVAQLIQYYFYGTNYQSQIINRF